jgi:hypothetical protein
MALNAYVSALQTLLHDPAGQFYPVATLTGFINEARNQVALEAECIKGRGTFSTVPGQVLYQASAVTSPGTPLGVGGLATPVDLSFNPGFQNNPLIVLEKRNWAWFQFYVLGMAAPPPGLPTTWCPFQEGTPTLPQGGETTSTGPTAGSSFYLNTPSLAISVNVDGLWYPIPLAVDTDPEAIPGPWTDAVPLYAQYLAYLDARQGQAAEESLKLYGVFMARARGIVTPRPTQDAYPGGQRARQAPGQAPPKRGGGEPAGRGGGQ